MAKKRVELPDITLDQLRGMLSALDVKLLLLKELAPNDNSKNQPYLSGSLDVTNILPSDEVYVDETEKGNRIMKTSLPLEWLQPDGSSIVAPNAKLILYPQYPEVRFSGFLKGAVNAPSELMTTRIPGRLMFFGITGDRRIIAWCAGPDSQLARAIPELGELEAIGVFRKVPLAVAVVKTSRQILLEELRRIHQLDWIVSKALRRDGTFTACVAPHCIGYTLEAELGVWRNGKAEPDFEGWEVKANLVNDFAKVPPSKVITLMTPEPTGGLYRTEGVEKFIRTFGYEDRMGREDRLNFGGVHRVGEKHHLTGLTLTLNGYNPKEPNKFDPAGSLSLVTDDGVDAASWSFASLLKIWSTKHAQAVYVPGELRLKAQPEYRYGNSVRLAEGTSFTLLVRALASGQVFYDPGIKLENASTAPAVKRRSQFRLRSSDMPNLYEKTGAVNVLA